MKNLQSLLIERGVATMRQIEEAMAKQVLYGGDLASHVLEQVGPGAEEALLSAHGAFHGLTPATAGPLPPSSPRAAQVVATELALRHLFYPLSLDETGLRVAVAAPLPEEVEGDLFFVLSVPPRQMITSRIRVRQALARDFGLPLEPREQRLLSRLEGRPKSPSTVPPPPAVDLAPPSLRVATRPLPADLLQPSPLATSVGSPPAGAPSEPAASPAWPQATRGLVRWMQRASQPPTDSKRPRSRRRGPMPLGSCEESLGQAQTGEEVLQTFFDFAQQYFVYSALFVVHGDLAEGRDAYGPGADRERVTGVGVPLDLPSCLAHARNRGAPVSVALQGGLDASLTSDLGRSPRGSVLVVPVLVRQRCVALLYADDGDGAIELGQAAEVIAASALAGGHLERLAVSRRRRSHPTPVSGVAGPEIVRRAATISGTAPPSFGPAMAMAPAPQNRQHRTQALARALGLRDELPRAVTPPPTLASPVVPSDDSNPFRRITASFQAVARPTEVDEPVPATMAARGQAASPEAPEVQVSESDLDDDELVQSALREMFASSPLPPMSERRSYSPPAVPPSGHQLAVLPSVIVDLGEDQLALVDRLVSGEGDEDTLLGEVLAEGVRLVPALLAQIPGPLRATREAMVAGEVRPSQGGPLLRALTSLRRTALPFLVVQSGHSQPNVRVWATLLLGEMPYPETVSALVPRLLDVDPEVVRAATTSARLLRSSEAVFAPLISELRRLAATGAERPEQRAAAASLVTHLSA